MELNEKYFLDESVKHELLNLDSICRLCITEHDGLQDLLTANLRFEDIVINASDLMNLLLERKLDKDSTLPYKICPKCVVSAYEVFKFKTICDQSIAIIEEYGTYAGISESILLQPVYEEACEDDETPDNRSVCDDKTPDDRSICDGKTPDDRSVCDDKTPDDRSICGDKTPDDRSLCDDIGTEMDDIDDILDTLQLQRRIEHPTKLVKDEERVQPEKVIDQSPEVARYKKSLQSKKQVEISTKPVKKVKAKKIVPLKEKITPMTTRSKRGRNRDKVSLDGESLICPICGYLYKNKYILKEHIQRHYDSRFLCSICGKGFKVKNCLARHIDMHADKKEHTCPDCGRHFTTAANLRLHSRTHSGQKPYLCMMCGKSFGHPTSLSYHMRIHTQMRPFACEICDRRFTIQCHYNRHKLTHTGERPFPCPICGKGFIKKYDMQRHEKTHGNITDYLCKVCDEQFLDEKAYRTHSLIHSDCLPYLCSICGKGFLMERYLKNHAGKCTLEKATMAAENAVLRTKRQINGVRRKPVRPTNFTSTLELQKKLKRFPIKVFASQPLINKIKQTLDLPMDGNNVVTIKRVKLPKKENVEH